jgi:hypothetical protein
MKIVAISDDVTALERAWREVLEPVENDPSMADINRHLARKAVHEG